MYCKTFVRLRHQVRVASSSLLERKILLWAAFEKEGKKKAGENYYQLFVSDEEGYYSVFIGGETIREKLNPLKNLILDKPTTIEIQKNQIDSSTYFNDIFFHDIDELAAKIAEQYPDIGGKNEEKTKNL